MKKVQLKCCLSALLALSLVACSDSNMDADSPDAQTDADIDDSGDTVRDGGEDGAGDSGGPGLEAALEDTPPQDGASVDDKDLCPQDPHKTDPGKCGCGIPDTRVCGKLLRQDLQDAIVHTMWAYYLKGEIGQYDSYSLLKYKAVPTTQGSQAVWVDLKRGSNARITSEVAPEYGTSDTTIFSVCSSYPYMSMYNSILRDAKPFQFNAQTGPEAAYYSYKYASTREMWRGTPNQAVLMRWSFINFEDKNKDNYEKDLNERKYSSEVDYPTSKGWKNEQSYLAFKDFSPEQMQQWWKNGNWEGFLQPGDIIVYLRKDSGHAIEYVGNGMVVDSAGGKYTVSEIKDEVTNIYNQTYEKDTYESDGTFNLYSIKDYFCKDNSGFNAARKEKKDGPNLFREIIIIRPVNLMLTQDAKGKLTDEVKPEYSIAPSALSRIRYPGIEIDRTVDLTPYGTASKNQPVTYRIRITNHSQSTYQGLGGGLNEENINHSISFAAWVKQWAAARGESMSHDYKGLVVKDVIPKGTRLISEDSYDFDPSTGTIRWKIDVTAGETVVLSYSVVIEDDHGDYIISEGGQVDAIAMNTLKNRVGNGTPVTKAQLQDYFHSHSAPELFPTQHAFIKDVFENVFKAGTYKSPYDIATKELFDRYNYKRTTWPSTMDPRVRDALKSTSQKLDYFILKGTFDDEFKMMDGSFRDYLVEGFLGGRRVWTPDNTLRILEFRSEYLMPGDIYVRAVLDTDGDDHEGTKAKWTKIFVYMGDDEFIYYDFTNKQLKKGSFKDTPNELFDAFTKDYFFVIRSWQ